jgi:predicted O-methyltransferase YrrM
MYVNNFESLDVISLEKKIEKSYPDIIIDNLYEYVFSVSNNLEKLKIIKQLKAISMLHNDTLFLLKLFGKLSKKGILDLGAYVGGGTIAMSLEACVPVVAVESGGSELNHPFLPSNSIIDDFINNIVEWGVDKKISLVLSKSYDENSVKKINSLLQEIDLILIDSDGHIERDINQFSELMVNKCIVVIDDYVSSDEKSKLVRQSVDKLVQEKKLEPFGVFMWGTWFGRFIKP